MRVKANAQSIIFDMDGTLVNTMGLHSVTWKETFGLHGKDVPVEKIEPFIGTSTYTMITSCFDPDASLSLEKMMRKETNDSITAKIADLGETLIFPEVEDVLINLRNRKVKMGLGSDNSRDGIGNVLRHTKLSRFFSSVVSAEDVGNRRKPDPAVFIEAARRLDVDPKDTLIIGDTARDMEAAKKGGFRAAVQFIYDRQASSISKHADVLIYNFGQLSDLF